MREGEKFNLLDGSIPTRTTEVCILQREKESVSRDKSQFEAVVKQEQSETILSSPPLFPGKIVSLSLSLSLPPGGRKKEEGIERPRFVNFFSRRWKNNKETRMKLRVAYDLLNLRKEAGLILCPLSSLHHKFNQLAGF